MKQTSLLEYINNEYIPFLKIKRTKEYLFNKDSRMLSTICSYPVSLKSLNELTENDIHLFLSSLLKQRKIKPATTNRYRAMLHAVVNHAIQSRQFDVKYNVVASVKKYKELPRNRCLTLIEVKQLLLFCKESTSNALYLAVVLAINTGMRTNEILSLQMGDITENIIKLRATQTKSGTSRVIILNEKTLNILNDYLAKRNIIDRNIFNVKSIKKSFKTASEKAGLKNLRFHDLRRVFATYLHESGVSLRVIQEMLGHSSLMMTQIYLSSSLGAMTDAAEKLHFLE